MDKKKKIPGMAYAVMYLILGVGAFSLLNSCESKKEERKELVSSCVEAGVTFYKENTNSYPTFLTYPDKGRSTYDVVKERCEKNTKAFDDLK